MTTYTITFPHKEGIPIAVMRHELTPDHPIMYWHDFPTTTTWHASLASVLRLIRLASDQPRLVQLPEGIALELIVNNA